MIVVAIIGILAAVALPAYRAYIDRADASCWHYLGQLNQALLTLNEEYALEVERNLMHSHISAGTSTVLT